METILAYQSFSLVSIMWSQRRQKPMTIWLFNHKLMSHSLEKYRLWNKSLYCNDQTRGFFFSVPSFPEALICLDTQISQHGELVILRELQLAVMFCIAVGVLCHTCTTWTIQKRLGGHKGSIPEEWQQHYLFQTTHGFPYSHKLKQNKFQHCQNQG